jgi:hypothetical protein
MGRDRRSRIVYLGSMVEKCGKIKNKTNERTGKAPKLLHVAKSLLWD